MSIITKIIADSLSHSGERITTFELTYPRFIHSEVMTHRIYARNASSSRAIPIQKMIQMILDDPAMPVRWGKNGKGMQDHGEMSPDGVEKAKSIWLAARDSAVMHAREYTSLEEQPHKQIVNRILEPYAHIRVVFTGTNYSNFFGLRRHEDADPTIYALADSMWENFSKSEPKLLGAGEWHLPYIEQEELDNYPIDVLLKISAARCARVSYRTRDEQVFDLQKDLNLFIDLLESEPLHASPAEHQATPDYEKYVDCGFVWSQKEKHGPFTGWIQQRKLLDNEFITEYKGQTMKAIITIEDSGEDEVNTSLQFIAAEGEEFTDDFFLPGSGRLGAYLMDILNDPTIADKVDTWIKERVNDAA